MATKQRTGEVHFADASLSICEDGMPRGEGFRGEWETTFKREVFNNIVQQLNRLGWTCTMPEIDAHSVKHYGGDVARWSAERKRFCQKGDLKADLDMCGRTINFKMFQSVNTPTRPDHEGRYESNKEACMPYPLRLEMERTRRRIRDYLCSVFEGYTFKPSDPAMGFMGVTADEKAAHDRRTSGHYKPALDRAEISMPSNAIAGDGGTIVHGSRVWAIDSKGRIITGTAFYSLNDRWQLVTGRYGLTYVSAYEVFTNQPENLRLKRNLGQRRKRLEQELQRAVAAMNFRQAQVLKDVLFPGDQPLYHIKVKEDGLLFRQSYCGYTRDRQAAGRYTREELRPYLGAALETEKYLALEVSA